MTPNFDFRLNDDENFDFTNLQETDVYKLFIRSIQNYRNKNSKENLAEIKNYYNQLQDSIFLTVTEVSDRIHNILREEGLFNEVVLDGFELKDDDVLI